MDFNTILQPLQNSFIAWANQYHLNTTHYTFSDLANCQFFSHMLSRVQIFRWLQQIQWSQLNNLQTSEKIKRLRVVGRSISNFYHTQKQLSIDNLAFNYVQMCLGNSQAEILKLVIATVGVLMQNEQIRNQLESFLSQLEEQNASLFRIMVDYAYRLGEKIGETGESPIKRQKKLILKLQSLQEEVQFYEDYVVQLQSKLEVLNEQVIRFKVKNEELTQGGDKLMKKVQNLAALNDLLNRQLESKSKQQEILTQRLALNRLSAQQVLDRLIAQVQKQRQDAEYFRKQLAGKNALQHQNKKIKRILEQKLEIVQDLQIKSYKQSQLLLMYENQIKVLSQSVEKLKTDNQSLSLKVQLLQKRFPYNRTYYCSPEQQSIVYATRLGDSYMQNTPKQWFSVEQDQNSLRHVDSEQSLAFSFLSGQSPNYPANRGYISIKQLQNSCNQQNQTKENSNPNVPNYIKLSQVAQQKSIQISQSCLKHEDSQKEQLNLAILTIFDLYSSLQHSRKQLRSYQSKQAQKAKRSARFAAKIEKMFA